MCEMIDNQIDIDALDAEIVKELGVHGILFQKEG